MRTTSTRVLVSGLATVTLLAGCMTLEQMAPPIGADFQRVAERRHVDVATVERGREVYIMDCARCHGVEPIGRYSESDWREILPRMGKETKLDADEQAALDAYVLAAHSFLAQESANLASAQQLNTN